MALLDNTSQRAYYQGSNQGNYQFVSLDDIINQFMVVYVGDEKIIRNCSRVDVAFHAQRALAELSFDTFKSVKSQEITLPPSLTMMLPHDYVNYVKLTSSDDSGVEHVLYPTSKTSNPFPIKQNDDGSYDFNTVLSDLVTNADFSSSLLGTSGNPDDGWIRTGIGNSPTIDNINTSDNKLTFTHGSRTHAGQYSGVASNAYCVWQRVKVTGIDLIDISADGVSAASATGKGVGVVTFGVSTLKPDGIDSATTFNQNILNPLNPNCRNIDHDTIYNLSNINGVPGYVEFSDGAGTSSTKTIEGVDVSGVPEDTDGETYIYILITSFIPNFTQLWTSSNQNQSTNTIDNIDISYDGQVANVQRDGDSTTWSNYKSSTPSENSNDDYEDDTYWPYEGRRYGLDPQLAQVNGSFYIDELKGLINFSSPLSGKNIILKYISDGLGTEQEMKVHKFAEEAMYKHIIYAVLSSKIDAPDYIVRRFKKERFAAVRQAKLRLSNIKLEEITQILRGKSKQIKH